MEKSALEVLSNAKIADKDIKTTNASFYPKYEYQYSRCTEYSCPPSKNVVVVYVSSETISVKVRNTDDVGDLTSELSAVGVSDLSGPNFSIDNEDALKAEARRLAIEDARVKGEELAQQLGASLGKVVYFSESGDYPMPYYANDMMSMKAVPESAPRAELPKGENTVSSDVSITFEIR